MADQTHLVTTCTFKGREFVLKMNVSNGNSLELSATDKFSAEEWSCCFDATFIENQTRKTGNFKHFEVFITMLKSGLLKSSDCVSVDLLTFEDLELLRSRKFMRQSSENSSRSTSAHNLLQNSNRRYLILTYIVEFDRVHYPLPLEYCGPPDPQVLQSIIRRLEAEVSKLRDQLAAAPRNVATNDKIKFLEHKIEQLVAENRKLTSDVQLINRAKIKLASSERRADELEKQLHTIEETWSNERKAHDRQVGKLCEEKMALMRRVHSLERSARVTGSRKSMAIETECVQPQSLRNQSRQGSESGVKQSTSKILPEQTRLEEMRTSLRKYKMNNKGKPPTISRSDDSLIAAAKILHGARSRSCSASSKDSSRRSRVRACCSSVVTESVPCGPKGRGRSRTRRSGSVNSGASASFQAVHSRNSSVSSRASTRSAHSARSNTRASNVEGPSGARKLKKCGNAKMRTVQDLELRIKKLQKLLEESKPA